MERYLRGFLIVVFAVGSAFVLATCGGTGGGDTGAVALYLTDDISDYQHVTTTVTRVEAFNRGTTQEHCVLLDEPVTVDIASLWTDLQLMNMVQCPAGDYNRIRIYFEQNVTLVDNFGTEAVCMFTDYKPGSSGPNKLNCENGNCTLDINGAVNVFVNQYSKLALDFDLKEFEVWPEPIVQGQACYVTMKVSPLHAGDMDDKEDYWESAKGYVSDLDTTARTFTLTKGKMVFRVSYAGIQQAGIDMLLERAQMDRLKTKVRTASIDLDSGTINAAAIIVKVEGIVTDYDPDMMVLTLSYQTTMGMKTMMISYRNAKVEDMPMDGVLTGYEAEVKLSGHDGTYFTALKVEFEEPDMDDDDDHDEDDSMS